MKAIVLSMLLAQTAWAGVDTRELEILDSHLEEISEGEMQEYLALNSNSVLRSKIVIGRNSAPKEDAAKSLKYTKKVLDSAEVVFDKVVQIGEKVWKLVDKNRPVVHVETATCHAIPKGVEDWQDLERWQMPKARFYHYRVRNGFGVDVVDFIYRVEYTPGGSALGRGQYLSNVTVTPQSLSVSWGFTFNASVSIDNVLNAGTSADPIAQVEIGIRYSVDTIFQHKERGMKFVARGNGEFQSLNL